MNLGISNLEQLPWQTQQAFEELIVQLQAWANGTPKPIDPTQTNATQFDQSSLFSHVNLQFATNAPWSLRWLRGPWLADPDGNSTHIAVLRPPQWTGNQNDYQPQGIDTALGMEIETDAARTLTGLHVSARSKRFFLIVNVGNFAITIKHASASSAAVNRFGLPANADLVLGSAEMAWMFYSVGSQVWRLAGTSAPGTAWGGGAAWNVTGSGDTVATGTLTNAQIKALSVTPVTIVTGPGAGFMNIPTGFWIHTRQPTAYDASAAFIIRYAGAASGVPLIGSLNAVTATTNIFRYNQGVLVNNAANSTAADTTVVGKDPDNAAIEISTPTVLNLGGVGNSVAWMLTYKTIAVF